MKQETVLPSTLIVEGNVGAGKSTFLKMLDRYLNAQLILEPHERWQDINGDNLLHKFYTDTSRWAYTFQTYAFITRVWEQQAALKNSSSNIHILERSVYSDRYCFSDVLHESGNITDLEWTLYKEWWNWVVKEYCPVPTGFIYLRVSPEICYERIQKRSRSEESGVPLSYIKKLHERHDRWLIEKADIMQTLHNVPVLVIDSDEDFEHNQKHQQEIIENIISFFAQHAFLEISKNIDSLSKNVPNQMNERL